jgi:hypothetical protein
MPHYLHCLSKAGACWISVAEPGLSLKASLLKVGSTGHVTGIDNTAYFIESGKETYADVKNLELIHADCSLTSQRKVRFDCSREGFAMAQ